MKYLVTGGAGFKIAQQAQSRIKAIVNPSYSNKRGRE